LQYFDAYINIQSEIMYDILILSDLYLSPVLRNHSENLFLKLQKVDEPYMFKIVPKINFYYKTIKIYYKISLY